LYLGFGPFMCCLTFLPKFTPSYPERIYEMLYLVATLVTLWLYEYTCHLPGELCGVRRRCQ
jgi:hypothetical protein